MSISCDILSRFCARMISPFLKFLGVLYCSVTVVKISWVNIVPLGCNREKEGVTIMVAFFFIMGERLLFPPGLGMLGFYDEADLLDIILWSSIWFSRCSIVVFSAMFCSCSSLHIYFSLLFYSYTYFYEPINGLFFTDS